MALAFLIAGCQPDTGIDDIATTETQHAPGAESPRLDAKTPRLDEEPSQLHPEIVAAHNRFGYLLFADLVEEALSQKAGNVVMSPLSIALALSLAENGAAGETALAMAKAMQRVAEGEISLPGKATEAADPSKIDDLTTALNESNLALIQSLTQTAASGDIRLKIANALWHRLGLPLSSRFAEAAEAFYDAEVFGLDFAADDSVDAVNTWADEATEGLIPKVVDELSEDLAALIANAVYFEGDWQTPFDNRATRPLPFRLPSGDQPDVETMYRSGSIEYYEADFQAVRLPYGEAGRTAMYLFLPPEDQSIEAFAARFEEVASEAFGNFRAYEGEVYLPRLDVSFKSSLNDALKHRGMGIAFDSAAADFSRMITGARPGDFFIGDVLHQAVLKVDETGTEAAAVTTVEIRLTSVPIQRFSFRADRPFLLAIRDDETGAILFAGAIIDPRG